MKTINTILTIMLLMSCAKNEDHVEPWCLIIKQAPTGEYKMAQLTRFAGNELDNLDVCNLWIADLNADPVMTGTSAKFRCECPAP